MSLRTRVISFSTGTGAATTTVVVPHLLGEVPKLLIFFHGGGTTTEGNQGLAGPWRMAFGFCNCVPGTPVSASLSINAAGGTASTRGAREFISDTASICLCNAGATTPSGTAHVTSVDAANFTLTIDIAFTLSIRVGVLCLSGEDVENVFVGTGASPGSTGTFDLTGAGFNPRGGGRSLLLLAQNSMATFGTCTAPSHMSVGAAISSSEECVVCAGTVNTLTPTRARRYNYDDECAAVPVMSGGDPNGVGNRIGFSSWITDGLRLNQLELGVASSKLIYAIIDGPRFAIEKAVTSASVNGTVAVTGAGFRPEAALVLSTCDPLSTLDTATGDGVLSIGAWGQRGEQWAGSGHDLNNVATTVNSENESPNAVYLGMDTATGLWDNPMRLQTVDADGATYVMTGAAPVGADNFFNVFMGPATGIAQPVGAVFPVHTHAWQ